MQDPPRKQLTVTEQCGLFSDREDYDEFLTEKISDTCLLEATQQSVHHFFNQCRIGACMFSDDCWNAMVADLDCRGYSGTHQLLFMVASWRMQCGRSFLPSLDNLMTNCSSQMFSRYCEIKNGNFSSESQDIFLEYGLYILDAKVITLDGKNNHLNGKRTSRAAADSVQNTLEGRGRVIRLYSSQNRPKRYWKDGGMPNATNISLLSS
ncbi:hypothetical protein HOLleu_18032 [Holothuria leucospilota]|uniref:Uncharacterized protein n=1 Tax=Holothuria leucospilota TaxID=206669 RepID=A0A9Q1H9A6_HOLLE|nr:hypothetical protein HOLleu_18032 [Holothuria leucospilota]